jgi:hypothetical protein
MNKRKSSRVLCLEAMALDIPEFPGHPNRVPFSGVLTLLDVPSDRSPAGAAGHRVLLPRRVAERALPSLLGMAMDFAPGLRGHDVRRKIGIITRAEIADSRLEVSGYLFGKDFPEVIRELRAHRDQLGMSYEVTGVRVADPKAEIWVLEDIVFTGAAILERTAAAYQTTSLAATAGAGSAPVRPNKKGEIMDEKITKALELLAQTNQALVAEMANVRAALDGLRQAYPPQLSAARDIDAVNTVPAALEARIEELARATEELRRQNEALRAQAERFSAQSARKTVPPQVLTLLAKSGVGAEVVGGNGKIEVTVLDKALDSLPVEQRIAIKSQLARAGALD